VILPRIEVVELAALAGFDAVILDQEHGPIGVEALPELVAAAQGAGLACVVRVPECRAKAIEAALDVGADAVLVPHVASADAARDAVAAARFAPDGRRGANPWVRAARYGALADFASEANDRCACLALVEETDGVAAIEDILAVPGLDAVFVGPVDLSHSLGYAGQPEHPAVVETVSGLRQRPRRARAGARRRNRGLRADPRGGPALARARRPFRRALGGRCARARRLPPRARARAGLTGRAPP
jgi:4-hydroxy-2-oxoheptanedioate aldolase